MNKEMEAILEEMLEEVSELKEISEKNLDEIWYHHYDSIVTSIECKGEYDFYNQIEEIKFKFHEEE